MEWIVIGNEKMSWIDMRVRTSTCSSIEIAREHSYCYIILYTKRYWLMEPCTISYWFMMWKGWWIHAGKVGSVWWI
jgi:hypothetical protein